MFDKSFFKPNIHMLFSVFNFTIKTHVAIREKRLFWALLIGINNICFFGYRREIIICLAAPFI